MKLIVEMEMPKCCDDCDANYDCCACGISGALWFHNPRYKEFDSSKERLPDCPIIGVLPDEHGDLIDRDALMIELMDRGIEGVQTDDLAEFQQIVMDAKAVVAAERKDDEQIH